MAKFCTKCGRMLADGEVCNCGQTSGQNQYQNGYQGQMGGQYQNQNGYQSQMGGQYQNQSGYQGQMGGQYQNQNGYQGQMGGQYQNQNGYQGQYSQMAGQYAGQAAAMAKGVWANIVDIIKKPVTTGKRLVQEANIKTALILIFVHAIMNAVFIKLVQNKIVEEAYNEAKANSFLYEDTSVKITMPYLRAFIVTILLTLCVSCALAGLMLACYRVAGVVVSYTQMLALVSVRSAMLIPAVFVSGIIFIISWGYGIDAFIIVSIIGLIGMVCTATTIVLDDKKDRLVLLMSIMVIAFLIVKLFIIYKMCPLYLPEQMQDDIDKIKNMF